MTCVGIGVMMAVIMIMAMVMSMIVRMAIACANTFDMMMVALLCKANLVFKSQHLVAILALLAIHIVISGEDVTHSFSQCIEHQRVIV